MNNNCNLENVLKAKKLKCLYTNCRSFLSNSKKKELEIYIRDLKLDIIGLTETWGRETFEDGEMELTGYKLYRKDRHEVSNNRGGRVELYVRENLVSCLDNKLSAFKCESIWCRIYTDKCKEN